MPHAMGGTAGAVTETWCSMHGLGPKTQTLSSHHPSVPFSKTLGPAGRARPGSPTLTSSQWSLSSCSTRAVCSGVCGTTVDCWKGPTPVG